MTDQQLVGLILSMLAGFVLVRPCQYHVELKWEKIDVRNFVGKKIEITPILFYHAHKYLTGIL